MRPGEAAGIVIGAVLVFAVIGMLNCAWWLGTLIGGLLR